MSCFKKVTTMSAEQAAAEAAVVREMLNVNLRDDVYVDQELNNRELDDPIYTEHLAGLIEETGGLLEPIALYRTPPERLTEHKKPYELGFGYQRAKALNLLAEQHGDERWITSVPATLRENVSLAQRHVEQLIENLGRKDLSPMETALALQKAINDPQAKLNMTALAHSIRWPVPTVSNYLKVARLLIPEVVALVLADKLSWSAAKEIVAIEPTLDAKQQKMMAELGCTLPFAKFVEQLHETYKQNKPKTDEVSTGNATGTTAAAPVSTQKAATSIRSNVLQEKYLKKLTDDLAALKGNDKIKQEARIDTMKFVLNQQGTELGAMLAPWEAALQEQADAEKAQNERDHATAKYKRSLITLIEAAIRAGTEAVLAGTGKPVDFDEAFARAKVTVEASLAAAKEKGLEENMLLEGFPIKSVDDFMAELHVAYNDHNKKKKERADAAKAAKDKKAADEKAAADAAAAGTAEAPATEAEAPATEAPVAEAPAPEVTA